MYKLSLLINANQGLSCGWSETYATNAADIAAARTVAFNLSQARRQCLTQYFSVVGTRISTMPDVGPSKSQIWAPAGPVRGFLSGGEDYPNVASLMRLNGGEHSTNRDMRGWPDNDITSSVAGAPITLSPGAKSLLNNFITFLAGGSYGWMRSAEPGDPTYLDYKVATVVPDAANGISKLNGVVPAGMIAAPLKPIVVSGFSGPLSKLNGTFSPKEYEVAAGYIQVKRLVTESAANGYVVGTAKVAKQGLAFQVIEGGGFVRISARKTGRPFGLLRGRRSAQK